MSSGSVATRLTPDELERPEVTDAWRALAELRSNPFLTPEWYRSWLEAHPDEDSFAIAWRVDGELRGVLPLLRAGSPPIRVLRFAGGRRGDWFTPACRIEEERPMAVACAAALSAERSAWQLLSLDRIDDESAWPVALWEAGARRGLGPGRARRGDVLPYIRFDDGGYEGWLANRSRNFRSQLGRRRRKLERDHGLTFRMTEDPRALDADLSCFYRLHEERWDSRDGESSLTPDARETHRTFAAAALERGWLRLWIAEADGRPAAAWYGWRLGERYCFSLSGLSPDYERLALGTVLLAHTIEHAAGEGAAIYDLMWGDEGYKERFETGRRTASSWTLGRRGHPVRTLARSADRLRAAARDLPDGVKDPAKRALGVIGRGRV